MRRELWSESRRCYDAIRLTLVLGALGTPGSATIAAATAPVFMGTISSPTLCSPRGTALLPGGGLLVGSDCQALHHMEQFDAAGTPRGQAQRLSTTQPDSLIPSIHSWRGGFVVAWNEWNGGPEHDAKGRSQVLLKLQP